MIRGLVMLLAILLGSAGAQAQQGRNPPAEQRAAYFSAALPFCDSGEVLGEMTSKFNLREAQYWNSSLAMVSFDRVRETAWRPWGREFVPRRFCNARVYTNDGRRRHVRYFVRETLGPIGNSWEVIWCVVGLDRQLTYSPGCEQATPWN